MDRFYIIGRQAVSLYTVNSPADVLYSEQQVCCPDGGQCLLFLCVPVFGDGRTA
ncbi:hypothetical protein [Alicyclobacillus sp. SP_1]|uniref:hypothetical protein n=1 Tax=Alicyclobacillus sp. SP_1 TaxID=2942475 RepID=UPI0021580BF8|nr:hypothetical protein [Alicyclobacillus sp. SP_1]